MYLAFYSREMKPPQINDYLLRVVQRLFGEVIATTEVGNWAKDAKTELQEWLQARRLPVLAYRIVATRGQAHAQTFEVVLQSKSSRHPGWHSRLAASQCRLGQRPQPDENRQHGKRRGDRPLKEHAEAAVRLDH